MRFMMLMHPGDRAETGALPDQAAIAAMMKYNEELSKAGVLISLDGLQPSSKGAQVRFTNGKPTVTDGPFTESKELIGGFWMIQVKSKEEAVEWAKRCPAVESNADFMIEVRQVFELSDFGIDQNPELCAQVERVSAGIAKP